MRKEACVLFSTGYMTNQGLLQSLAGRGDVIFSDKDNHACILAGQQVSAAETVRYRHSDMAHLRTFLERISNERPEAGKLIATDGVFSMSGTLAKVPALVELAEEFGAGPLPRRRPRGRRDRRRRARHGVRVRPRGPRSTSRRARSRRASRRSAGSPSATRP